MWLRIYNQISILKIIFQYCSIIFQKCIDSGLGNGYNIDIKPKVPFRSMLVLASGGSQEMIDDTEQLDTEYYSRKKFRERLETVMEQTNISWDSLADLVTEAGYRITTSNLKLYVNQRNISLKLLITISRVLRISMDYLIGNDADVPAVIYNGFDYHYDSQRYMQYAGYYFVYFFPTRTNEPEEIIEATLNIDEKKSFYATFSIPVIEAKPKVYNGHLILSAKTDTAFLNMYGTNGELIEFIFNDPKTNQNKIRFCVSALVSVSSGDAKRMPTLSRAVITEKALTDEGKKIIEAHLRLNSKYIDIQREKLQTILSEFLEHESISDADNVCSRLLAAFKPKTIYSIEEQYLLNTFRIDNDLSNLQVERLIAELRRASLSSINCKTPRSLDARLYLLMRDAGMFKE